MHTSLRRWTCGLLALVCLLLLGQENGRFLIPALVLMIVLLLALRPSLERGARAKEEGGEPV